MTIPEQVLSRQDVSSIGSAAGEAGDYQRLVTLLVSVREHLGSGDHAGAEAVSRQLEPLALQIMEQAGARHCRRSVKSCAIGAVEQGGDDDEWGDLIRVQTEARVEFLVTLDALSDLLSHTSALRAGLAAHKAVTYDARGRAHLPGGTGP